METKFNTGRKYQADGQWIRAKLMDDGFILFADDSRGIAGRIPPRKFPVDSERELQRVTLSAYDHNDYRLDDESWTYMMQGKR